MSALCRVKWVASEVNCCLFISDSHSMNVLFIDCLYACMCVATVCSVAGAEALLPPRGQKEYERGLNPISVAYELNNLNTSCKPILVLR